MIKHFAMLLYYRKFWVGVVGTKSWPRDKDVLPWPPEVFSLLTSVN